MTVAARPGPPARSTAALVWLALIVASSAVLVDLLDHWWTSAWARYSLVFVPLALFVAHRGAGVAARPISAPVIGLGVLIEVLAVGGGFDRWGRIGLAVALVGMTGIHRVGGWSRRLCVLWIVPIPAFLHAQLDLTALWAQIGAATSRLLGPEVRWADSVLWIDSSGLPLFAPDGGLAVVALLAGIGWHASAYAGASLRAAALQALRWGALGIPIQAAAVVLAAVSLGWLPLESTAVRTVLWNAPWIAGAALGLAMLPRAIQQADRRREAR